MRPAHIASWGTAGVFQSRDEIVQAWVFLERCWAEASCYRCREAPLRGHHVPRRGPDFPIFQNNERRPRVWVIKDTDTPQGLSCVFAYLTSVY